MKPMKQIQSQHANHFQNKSGRQIRRPTASKCSNGQWQIWGDEGFQATEPQCFWTNFSAQKPFFALKKHLRFSFLDTLIGHDWTFPPCPIHSDRVVCLVKVLEPALSGVVSLYLLVKLEDPGLCGDIRRSTTWRECHGLREAWMKMSEDFEMDIHEQSTNNPNTCRIPPDPAHVKNTQNTLSPKFCFACPGLGPRYVSVTPWMWEFFHGFYGATPRKSSEKPSWSQASSQASA